MRIWKNILGRNLIQKQSIFYLKCLHFLFSFEKSRVLIYFEDAQFITSQRYALYDFMDFLANCGGLFGLACGVSVLSLIEILYYVSMFFACNLLDKYSTVEIDEIEVNDIKIDP